MKGGENHETLRFSIEVNVAREGWTLTVLWLHHGATLQSAVGATVVLYCNTVCFNKLFGEVNIFSIVLSKKDSFLNVLPFYFYEIH
jgi:hypothetical protein